MAIDDPNFEEETARQLYNPIRCKIIMELLSTALEVLDRHSRRELLTSEYSRRAESLMGGSSPSATVENPKLLEACVAVMARMLIDLEPTIACGRFLHPGQSSCIICMALDLAPLDEPENEAVN